jgi:hypothetical protein
MTKKLVTLCSVALIGLLAGCQQQQRQRGAQTVALRFAMPPGLERFAWTPAENQNETELAATSDASTFEYSHTDGDTVVYSVNESNDQPVQAQTASVQFNQAGSYNFDEVNALAHADRYHVTLWGGKYQGQVVTHHDLDLSPGDYTFALWEQDPATKVQGNMQVRAADNALLGILQRWQQRIPELKQRLAYDAELAGQAGTDPEAFNSFRRQLKALDKLSAKINRAVWSERTWQKQNAPAYTDFVNDAVVLLLPGDERELDSRTRPAFCASDIQKVRTGQPLTKVVVVADYDTARWKTRMVDDLARELNVCKAVLWEEVSRLERRKRLLDITDHIYKHDQAFVRNEWQLQAARATIGALNDQLSDLSERRVALSFVTALAAPDQPFASLDSEQRDLEQERVVLSAEKSRLDQMFQNAGLETPKRVDLEAARQRYARAIENIDQRLVTLADDRLALNTLRDSSQVLHRQQGARVLAASSASSVADSIPARVRQAIEREALMSVRLQSQPNLFAPKGSDLTRVQTASYSGGF